MSVLIFGIANLAVFNRNLKITGQIQNNDQKVLFILQTPYFIGWHNQPNHPVWGRYFVQNGTAYLTLPFIPQKMSTA